MARLTALSGNVQGYVLHIVYFVYSIFVAFIALFCQRLQITKGCFRFRRRRRSDIYVVYIFTLQRVFILTAFYIIFPASGEKINARPGRRTRAVLCAVFAKRYTNELCRFSYIKIYTY